MASDQRNGPSAGRASDLVSDISDKFSEMRLLNLRAVSREITPYRGVHPERRDEGPASLATVLSSENYEVQKRSTSRQKPGSATATRTTIRAQLTGCS